MAEMASVPRLERCPPGPTSPSRALVTVECGETPSGRGPQEAACRCAGWAGMLSAAQLQCYHAGHPGPGPKLVDGLPEMRPRAPRIVSGQKRAGSLPGQGGERGHKDCVHMGHKQAKAWHRGTAAEAEVIHQRDHDAAQAKARHRGTGCRGRGHPPEGPRRSPGKGPASRDCCRGQSHPPEGQSVGKFPGDSAVSTLCFRCWVWVCHTAAGWEKQNISCC